MKSKLILVFILMFFVVPIASAIQYPEQHIISVDMRFVGTWKGSSYNEKEGYIKTWTQVGDKLGNYKILFKAFSISNDLLGEAEESGKWWVDNNLFYEFNPKAMNEPDVYRFQFIGKDEIQYIMQSHDISEDINGDYTEGYTFKEKKVY